MDETWYLEGPNGTLQVCGASGLKFNVLTIKDEFNLAQYKQQTFTYERQKNERIIYSGLGKLYIQ